MDEKERMEGEEFEQELGLNTTFSFPQVLTEHLILGRHLIIASENANWLVCDDEEYAAFGLFREGKNIQEVEELLMQQQMDSNRVEVVVSQLIAQILGKEFLRDAVVSEKPIFKVASLRITEGCNLRCTTCLRSCTVAGPDECSLDHWKKFLNAFKNFGSHTVALTGGEPMTNPDCFEIMRYAKEAGLKVVLLTNGTLVTKENAKILDDYCDEIRVSIDGPDAETNDSIRGKGTFGKAISALRELSAYSQCYLSVGMMPTPATLPYFRTGLRQFAEWVWREIRPNISIEVKQRILEGRKIPRMSKLERLVFKGDVCTVCNDQLGDDFIQKMDAVSIIPNLRAFGCGLAELVSVMANGDVGLCVYSPGAFCNIKDIGDGGVFILELAGRIKQLADSTRIEKLYPCANCDLRYFCGGKCREENRIDCGNPNVCECDKIYKEGWYEELVRINPYVVDPITDL